MCFVAHVKYAWSLVWVNRLVDDLKWLPFVYFSECVTFVYVWWYKNRFVCLTLTKCVHSNLHEMLNADTRRGRVREFKQGAYNIFKQIIYLTKWISTTNCSIFSHPTFSHTLHTYYHSIPFEMVDVFVLSLWFWFELTRTIHTRCNRITKEWNCVEIQ